LRLTTGRIGFKIVALKLNNRGNKKSLNELNTGEERDLTKEKLKPQFMRTTTRKTKRRLGKKVKVQRRREMLQKSLKRAIVGTV